MKKTLKSGSTREFLKAALYNHYGNRPLYHYLSRFLVSNFWSDNFLSYELIVIDANRAFIAGALQGAPYINICLGRLAWRPISIIVHYSVVSNNSNLKSLIRIRARARAAPWLSRRRRLVALDTFTSSFRAPCNVSWYTWALLLLRTLYFNRNVHLFFGDPPIITRGSPNF